MEEKIIQILVQGGLASVALVSLYFNYKIVSNHISHADRSNNDLKNAITKLTTFLETKLKD